MRKLGKPLGTAVAVLMAVMVLAGQAWAIYAGDGALPNGTTGGWDITDYGKCVSGVKADGTIVVDAAHNASRPDCIDHVLSVEANALGYPVDTDYDTSAECVATSGRVNNPADDVSHYWVSNICVDPLTGQGINLDGLDRTAANCTLKGGVRVNACTGAWTYLGPAGDGAPGFCYTTVNLTTAYPDALTCPTTTTGYTWASSKCTFSYGIAGYANAAINKKNGSGAYAAAGTFVDLGALTQGECLAAGASWSTGTRKAGTTSVATTPLASTVPFDPSTGKATIIDTRAGCLECHNSVSQYNSYAERWKETYLNTGHKNMLRKVTPGDSWAGPDGAIYTTDASGHAIDFLAGTVDIGGVDKPLMYIFGDWMAPLPNAIYDDTGLGVAKTDSGGSYSCAACHSTGWSNPAAGVCYPDSTKTTAATCLAPNTWVPSSGTEGATYTPAEPLASFPGYTSGITGKWDRDGIMCSRCHQSVFSQTAPAPAGTSSHHATVSTGTAEQATGICFGCHQSLATTYVAATIGGVSYPANAKILDPTMIPTGANHGSTAGREFNGHVLGNMFLNSPHARYTGTLTPNSLGKYSLTTNTPANYDSNFKGSLCRSSTTLYGGSILQTVWKGGAATLIGSLEDCNLANGFGTEAAPDSTSRGYWQSESQGNCSTCHNVHESLFDAAAEEPLRRECGVTCHADKADWNLIKHPMGTGTPIGDGTSATLPCEVCHMPKPTAEGFPMHLWRINTDAAYDTFPTAAEFNGTAPAVKDRRAKTSPDGTYTQAVWVDLDLACGQCHGGSAGAAGTKNGAPYYDKSYLAVLAAGMHDGALQPPTAAYTGLTTTNLVVSFTDNSSDSNHQAQSTLAVTVNWGDGKISTGVGGGVFTHTYATGGKYTILHTVKDVGNRYASEFISVTPSAAPVAVNHSISIKVYRNDGTTPVNQARVYLKKETAPGSNLYRQIAFNYTNTAGLFIVWNLPPANYQVVVYKSALDFNGAALGKQATLTSSPFALNLDSTVTFTQGASATPAWSTNGAAPTIVTTSP